MFALESALDELAVALQLDPVELRLRNHADADPRDGPAVVEQVAEGVLPAGGGAVRLGAPQAEAAVDARRPDC